MKKKTRKDLEICFHPPKGKAGLRIIKPSKGKAEGHLSKAMDSLRAMRLMYENDIFDWTIVCGYYAFYHALLATLSSIGIEATNHFCAITAFKSFFVERGKMPEEYLVYLNRAKELEVSYSESLEKAKETRVVVQYEITQLRNDDAEWIIDEAADFVEKMEEFVASKR
jgi:uncharacterized protein (UPF0332 family)